MRLLQPLSWLYEASACLDKALFDRGLRRRPVLSRPVIVVGNLMLGGAGKTPAVMALVRLLRAQGHMPGVVSRGYGRSGRGLVEVQRSSDAQEVGDEPLLIHLRTGAPVLVGEDRTGAVASLCQRHPEVSVVIADDGLQHHRLLRQLEVLVFDERGVGNGLLLPAGPLRQRLQVATAAHQIALYNAPQASTVLPGYVGQRRLVGVLPLAQWWANPLATAQEVTVLAGRPVLAAAGLAKPEAFFRMLEAHGLQLHKLALPDHCSFSPLPWPATTVEVIVTEKDAVKLRPTAVGDTKVWVATLDFEPEPAFGDAVNRHMTALTTANTSPWTID